AVEELDDRFLADEGAPDAEVLPTAGRLESLASEQFDAAPARFDALASDAPPGHRSPRPENMSTRAVQEWARLTRAGRFEDAAGHLRPDIVRRDFSTVVSFPTLE